VLVLERAGQPGRCVRPARARASLYPEPHCGNRQKLARQSGSKTIKKDALAKTQFDIVINATPVGMAATRRSQSWKQGPEHRWSSTWSTTAGDAADPPGAPAGIPFITGIEMFVQQGARQFEIFTASRRGRRDVRVVLHALRQQIEAAATAEAAESKGKAKPRSGAAKRRQSSRSRKKPSAAAKKKKK